MPSSKPGPPRRGNRVAAGRRYERLAAAFFTRNGFTILARNYRDASREIDLIARKDKLIVFIEVKASRTDAYGHPAERVDTRKQNHLATAARRYLAEHDIDGCDLRFDLVTFVNGELEHYPNAFLLDE